MDEDLMTANTLKKNANNGNNPGTKSIMRPSRKTAEEHHKSRAKMLAVANQASKNGNYKINRNRLIFSGIQRIWTN